MKRASAIAPLSRDHHQALVVAQKLQRANAEDAVAAREAWLTFWHPAGQAHFRVEEEVLLPAYATHGSVHRPEVVRTLVEHVLIRQGAKRLDGEESPAPERLQAFGAQVADHARFEERELFPLIERSLPSEALTALAEELEAYEGR